MVIDFHVHVLEPEVLARGIDRNVASGFGAPKPEPPGTRMAAVRDKMLNADTQIEDMDRLGIDVSVLSSATVIQGTAWAGAGTAEALNRRANDAIAGWVERFSDRFVGSFTLPLQEQRLALRELERCTDELRLRVANVPARFGEHYLGHRSFAGFWEAVAERGITVFVHPDGVEDPWFHEYSLWNSVGQPIEETKVMASLMDSIESRLANDADKHRDAVAGARVRDRRKARHRRVAGVLQAALRTDAAKELAAGILATTPRTWLSAFGKSYAELRRQSRGARDAPMRTSNTPDAR